MHSLCTLGENSRETMILKLYFQRDDLLADDSLKHIASENVISQNKLLHSSDSR